MVGFNAPLFFGCLLMGIIMNCSLLAQSPDLKFDHLNNIPELANRSVTSIVQDGKGFIWLGTPDGLLRYDGFSARIFKNNPESENSLSDNNIQALAVDSVGNLWIGTQSGGLNQFILDQERFVHHQNDPEDNASISGNGIWSLLVDSKGYLWAGSWSNGLNKFDPHTNKFERFSEGSNDPVLAVFEDSNGYIWYSSNGLNRLDVMSGTIDSYTSVSSDSTSLSSNNIRDIAQEANGTIWIATDNAGLNKLNHDGSTFTRFSESLNGLSSNAIYDIHMADDGFIWLATNAGLDLYNPIRDRFYNFENDATDPFSLSNNSPRTIFVDNTGSTWIGNEGGRINKTLDRKAFFTYNAKGGLSNNLIRSLYEDDSGEIWIGTQGGGLNVLSRDGAIRQLSQDSSSAIYVGSSQISAIKKHQNEYWVGTWGNGIYVLDFENDQTRYFRHDPAKNSISDNRIQVFHTDQQGVFWVGTENGLNFLDADTEQWRVFEGLNGNTIQGQAFLEDEEGELWIGTWNGLNKVSLDRRSVKSWRESEEGLINEHVISLCRQDEILWIGTFGGGLFRFDTKNETFMNYTENDGLPNGVIYGIRADYDRHLWMSTNNGLSRFDIESETFRNYDKSEGLQGNEFYWGAVGSTSDGRLMFGGSNGLNLFSPEEIKDNTLIPPIVISDFQIYNKPVPIGKDSVLVKSISYTESVELSYKDAVLTFSFAALNFNYPEKNQYAYKLEGFEKDWNYVGNRHTATYTNLDPGEYIFRVKGSNNDNVWNEEGTSLAISIPPPFWSTWWFYTLVGLALGGGVYWFIRSREKTLKRDKKALENAIAKAQQEVEDQKRQMAQQREKEKDRIWTDQGIVQLGEVLSSSKDDIGELCRNVLKTLVRYLEVRLAAIYLIDENQAGKKVLMQRADYGYDLKNKEFGIGDGMVGECFKHREVSYFDNLPIDYLKVTSGLGKSSASHLLLVPLIYEDIALGVMEIGCFKPIPEFKRDLVVTFSQRLTAAINTTVLGEKTKKLLDDSKIKAEELAVREEELQQNLEEMQAINEDRDRRAKEMEETVGKLKKEILDLRKKAKV
ncbi:MAG: two-component regulator propeller domain-containing protein [Bacteroidota bacterium]